MASVSGMPQTAVKRAGPWLAIAAVLGVTTVLLRAEGRLWWCKCGQPFLWVDDAWTSHNSQHLLDPYSFTHVLHGLVFYGVLAWWLPRWSLPWRMWLAIAVEAAWELIENTEFVIQRYREATAALGYAGDTIANVLGDILTCSLGFVLARYLGFRWSAALFVLTEVVLLIWIRDSLLLNVVMLLYPLDAIKVWQQAGH